MLPFGIVENPATVYSYEATKQHTTENISPLESWPFPDLNSWLNHIRLGGLSVDLSSLKTSFKMW